MGTENQEDGPLPTPEKGPDPELIEQGVQEVSSTPRTGWRKLFGTSKSRRGRANSAATEVGGNDDKARPQKWSMGVLNDKYTIEVPGRSHLLLV